MRIYYRTAFYLLVGAMTLAGPVSDSPMAVDVTPYPTPNIINLPGTFTTEFIDAANTYPSYWLAPLSWKSKEWGNFWSILAITGGLVLVDRPIYTTFDKKSWAPVKQSLDIFHQLGQWQYPGIAIAGLYVGSFVVQDSRLERASRIAIKSFVFQTMVNQGLKNLVFRTKIDDPYDFRLGPPSWDIPSDGAFPSGHASNTWSVMSAFAIAYADDPVIPPLCYGTALISSALLITNQDHWISDIFFGAALGYYSAEWVAANDNNRQSYKLRPIIDLKNGIGIAYDFEI